MPGTLGLGDLLGFIQADDDGGLAHVTIDALANGVLALPLLRWCPSFFVLFIVVPWQFHLVRVTNEVHVLNRRRGWKCLVWWLSAMVAGGRAHAVSNAHNSVLEFTTILRELAKKVHQSLRDQVWAPGI